MQTLKPLCNGPTKSNNPVFAVLAHPRHVIYQSVNYPLSTQKSKEMKHIKAELITGDFLENTMTFEVEGDFTLQAGKYIIVKEQDYKAPEMYEALKKIRHETLSAGNYLLVKSLLNEIDNGNK